MTIIGLPIHQFVITAVFFVWYFSVKGNRECFFAMMVVGLPIGTLAFLADWFLT